MTESPGWINSTPLIEECMMQRPMLEEIDINYSHSFEHGCGKDSEQLAISDVRAIVVETISVLRRRGLVNQQGLELIHRETGE